MQTGRNWSNLNTMSDQNANDGNAVEATPPPRRARFDLECSEAWLHQLREEGFVVVKQALAPDQVAKVIDLFWTHIEGDVSSDHRKPIKRDDLSTWNRWKLDKRGFMVIDTPQCQGAWFVRGVPKIHSAFSRIWGTKDLIVSMDAVIAWKPWWHNRRWKPATEGMHLDQNPFHKRAFVCVQGMVPLYDVTPAVGGLEVVLRSHTDKEKSLLRERYPRMEDYGDFCPLDSNDPMQKDGHLVSAKAGDLILWDGRTIHGGRLGTGMDKHDTTPQLARLSIPVCMTPRAWANESVLRARKHAFERGECLTHWPHEIGSHHAFGSSSYKPIDLTAAQQSIL